MSPVPALLSRPLELYSPGSVEHRLVVAAVRCVSRWGVAKTAVEDVAREAGVSRATVYRAFPGGKDTLLERATDEEVARFFERFGRRLEQATDLEDALVAALVEGGRTFTDREALRSLLGHGVDRADPERPFPEVEHVLVAVTEFLTPHLAPFVGEARSAQVADWITRIGLSYVTCPSEEVDLADESSVRPLVRGLLLTGFHPAPA